MKRIKVIKILCSILLISMLISVLSISFSASAASYVKGSNSASEPYKASKYYQNLLSVPLTGDNRTDVVAVALSQLGYTEGNSVDDFGGTSGGNNNFTEFNWNMGDFGQGYGTNNYHWCASFVAFCLLQARCHEQTRISDWCRSHKGDINYVWREVSCSQWAAQLRRFDYFEYSANKGGDYIPISGDLIFFTSNGSSESHIGIVLYSDGTNVYTVEGNTGHAAGLETNGGGVYAKSYKLSSSYIMGYGILPYAENNSVANIDYSGKNATPGIYMASTNKYIYTSEAASEYTYLLPKYSMFEITEVVGNGRLKGTFTIDGQAREGYIKNNTDRIYQLSSSVAPSTALNKASSLRGYTAGATTSFKVGSNDPLSTLPESTDITAADTLQLNGYIGFNRPIFLFGYYYDNDLSSAVWNNEFSVAADTEATSAAGKYAQKYSITVPTEQLSVGTHIIHFAVKLTDGSTAYIDELSVTVPENSYSPPPAQEAPAAPKVVGFTKNSITLTPNSAYEYRCGEGQWQKSNIFEGLDEHTQYTFYCRASATADMSESPASEPVSANISTLFAACKLRSLSVSGESISPSFSRDIVNYKVQVPHNTEKLTIHTSCDRTSTVTVADYSFSDDGIAVIKITVTPLVGEPTVYTLTATRRAAPLPPPEENEDGETDATDDAHKNKPDSTAPSATDGDSTADKTEAPSIEVSNDIDVNLNVADDLLGCSSSLSAGTAVILSLLCLGIAFKKKEN